MCLDCGYKPRAGASIHRSFPPSASRAWYFMHPLLQVMHSFIPGNRIHIISLHSSVRALESPGVVPREATALGIDRNSRVFGQGGIMQHPKYCHGKVFILPDKDNFSSIPPGAHRGDAGRRFVCLEAEVQFARPTAIPKHWAWPHPLPPTASCSGKHFSPPSLYVLKYGSCTSHEVYRCHSASYMSVTGINLHLFAYCFISFYDNVLHNII